MWARAGVMMLSSLLVVGCSAYGGWDPALAEAFAQHDQYQDQAGAETLSRVLGMPGQPRPPLSAESGNIWPGPTKAGLSYIEMKKTVTSRESYASHLAETIRHSGGHGLCQRYPVVGPGYALGLCYAGSK